ncbi:MAG: FHA domain-containing protein [Actinomycetota bacterium]|nr:FHA domain-containing protein [Actinomycetota bacterium]
MSTAACPNGHQSADPEWCDTCGAKMSGPADPAPVAAPAGGSTAGPAANPAANPAVNPAAGSPSGGTTVACPHCHEVNPGDALFCEVCGYDFTTGQAPPASPAATAAQPPVPVSSAVRWIAVVEVDPLWYSLKGALADQPCPPVSSATVPLANHTALVGRTSASRGVRPEVTLDADTGVSRRHAQFVRDGDDLTIVDLSSTNGTYVVAAGEQPDAATEAITAGVPRQLHDGDQVYVGAWSRLTVRSA